MPERFAKEAAFVKTGLFQDVLAITNSKIPFLSDLPGLGRLFVSGNQERRRTDVMISLTPRIVKIMERPDPEIETFLSGTADSFGPSGPIVGGAPVVPPRPVVPTPPPPQQQPGGGLPGGGLPGAPGAPAPSPRP